MPRQPRRTYLCYRCNKTSYETRGDAQRFLRSTNWTGMAAYKCPYGMGFHVGHSMSGLPFRDRAVRRQIKEEKEGT
jgi:hypothetical protein